MCYSPKAFKICPQDTSSFGIWNLEFGIWNFPDKLTIFLVPACPGCGQGKKLRGNEGACPFVHSRAGSRIRCAHNGNDGMAPFGKNKRLRRK